MHAHPSRIGASAALAAALAFAVGTLAGGDPPVAARTACTVDLTQPGQMADVLSNALVQGLGQDAAAVADFLDGAEDGSASGAALLVAAATMFELQEAALAEAVEAYRHVNCTHEGGGAASVDRSDAPPADGRLSAFAESVLHHVVLHELAHALVREFDLPVLGNEETLADAFATHFLVTHRPDRAAAVLRARVASLMVEANEVPRAEWPVRGEHESDARRAFQIAALAIAHDAEAYAFLAPMVEMSDGDMRQAMDYGTEIHRSWRRILGPLRMPAGQESGEVRVRVADGSAFRDALTTSALRQDLEQTLRSFDWHSQVTLGFEPGDGGAGWNRSRRTITVHDEYVARFVRQGRAVRDSADR